MAGVGILLPPWLSYLGLVGSVPVGVLGALTVFGAMGAEVFLAWRLGCGYAPEYSLLWSLRRAVQRVGAVMELRVSGWTLWFAAAGVVALVIVTRTAPMVVPPAVLAAHLVWVRRRERAWAQVHDREKREALGTR